MKEVIRTEKLHKYYKIGEHDVHALKGIDIKIFKNEFVSIMGSSGSGKSTLMNILGCLDVPTSGRYFLDDNDVSLLNTEELSEIRNLKIGFVFQSFNLLARSTSIDNVELPLIYNRNNHADRKQRARQALATVGLSDREDHLPSQLSGGQQQRVAIARAIVNDPEIILADEPTGNLDSRTGVEIMDIFGQLHDSGKTILMITHESDIASFAERSLKLKDGFIENSD